MNENNSFENLNSSEETILQNNSELVENAENFEQPQVLPQDEPDFELDPELTSSVLENNTERNRVFGEINNKPIEPIAPIMPQIEKNAYQPTEQIASSKGVKVFAVIIALILLISACVTGGYYLGISTQDGSKPVVDLASKPKSDKALTTSQIYNNVSESVVGIYVYNTEKGISATATGVIYSKDGYVITNDHIYDGIAGAKFKVYTHDNKMYSADYIAGDTRSDLAVLKITNAENVTFKPAELGNSSEAVVGESVVAIGRPNGATHSSIASEGIISATSTRVSTTTSYTSSLIQTDCAINPGNSGGALCNIYGQVIGITNAKLVGDEYDGVGYAIPTTTVKKVVESLIKNKTVKGRAKLGISYIHIDELTAELSNLPCGLKIAAIDKSCDLYGKSVEVDDIITHVNSVELSDSNIILDIIDSSKPGDTLDLKIYSVKTKKSFDINVKLLEDTGSSSYTLKSQENNKENPDNNNYNSSEFNFPNGE